MMEVADPLFVWTLVPMFAITIHEFMKLSIDSLKEIGMYSLDAPQTRKSLVKGERFIRSVWRAWADELQWSPMQKEGW